MIADKFLENLKKETESRWSDNGLNRNIYGFQFQPGTCWNPGLEENAILRFETAVGFKFPNDFKAFLCKMNGTDLPTLNIYGDSGEQHQHSLGVYVYPRDIEKVTAMAKAVQKVTNDLRVTLHEQKFMLPERCQFLPLYAHRYLLCTDDPDSSVVLSILDAFDVAIYGNSLEEYLQNEFLRTRH